MRRFAALCAALEDAPDPEARTAALAGWLATADEPDRAQGVALLAGRRPRRVATGAELRAWAAAAAGIPDWLVEDCRRATGDLAETLAHLPPAPMAAEEGLVAELTRLAALAGADAAARQAALRAAWNRMEPPARLVLNRLATGGFRLTLPVPVLAAALARATGADPAAAAAGLAGGWTADRGLAALAATGGARPLPFAPVSVLETIEALGPCADWVAEWDRDAPRVQLLRQDGALHVWTAAEPLTAPALAPLGPHLPEGAALAGWLMTRDGPRFMAQDWLMPTAPLPERRARLEAWAATLPPGLPLDLAPLLPATGWPALDAARHRARAHGATGLLLRRIDGIEERRWPAPPLRLRAVLTQAQADGGALMLALRAGDALVPIARIAPALPPEEATALFGWIRANIRERAGPVLVLPPLQVFEIAFDTATPAPRRKAGLALTGARLTRWLRDGAEADTLEDLRALIG